MSRQLFEQFRCDECSGVVHVEVSRVDAAKNQPAPLPNGWLAITWRYQGTKLSRIFCSTECAIKDLTQRHGNDGTSLRSPVELHEEFARRRAEKPA